MKGDAFTADFDIIAQSLRNSFAEAQLHGLNKKEGCLPKDRKGQWDLEEPLALLLSELKEIWSRHRYVSHISFAVRIPTRDYFVGHAYFVGRTVNRSRYSYYMRGYASWLGGWVSTSAHVNIGDNDMGAVWIAKSRCDGVCPQYLRGEPSRSPLVDRWWEHRYERMAREVHARGFALPPLKEVVDSTGQPLVLRPYLRPCPTYPNIYVLGDALTYHSPYCFVLLRGIDTYFAGELWDPLGWCLNKGKIWTQLRSGQWIDSGGIPFRSWDYLGHCLRVSESDPAEIKAYTSLISRGLSSTLYAILRQRGLPYDLSKALAKLYVQYSRGRISLETLNRKVSYAFLSLGV